MPSSAARAFSSAASISIRRESPPRTYSSTVASVLRQFLRHRDEIELAGHRVVAGVRPEIAAQQRQQARLAAAVSSDDSDLVAAENGEVGAVKKHRGAPAQAHFA